MLIFSLFTLCSCFRFYFPPLFSDSLFHTPIHTIYILHKRTCTHPHRIFTCLVKPSLIPHPLLPLCPLFWPHRNSHLTVREMQMVRQSISRSRVAMQLSPNSFKLFLNKLQLWDTLAICHWTLLDESVGRPGLRCSFARRWYLATGRRLLASWQKYCNTATRRHLTIQLMLMNTGLVTTFQMWLSLLLSFFARWVWCVRIFPRKRGELQTIVRIQGFASRLKCAY